MGPKICGSGPGPRFPTLRPRYAFRLLSSGQGAAAVPRPKIATDSIHNKGLITYAGKDSAAKEKVQYWLLMNGLTDHVNEIYWDETDPDEVGTRRLRQVSRLKRQGPLSLVYEADTEAATALLKSQIPTMLFLHPTYTHPDFRPGHSSEPTPWNELVLEKVRQQEARSTDTRLQDF